MSLAVRAIEDQALMTRPNYHLMQWQESLAATENAGAGVEPGIVVYVCLPVLSQMHQTAVRTEAQMPAGAKEQLSTRVAPHLTSVWIYRHAWHMDRCMSYQRTLHAMALNHQHLLHH